MVAYEILLMLDPELAEERQDQIVVRTRELIEQARRDVGAPRVWGRRRLAYEIDHKSEGTYHLLLFDATPDDARRAVAHPQDHGRRHAAPGRARSPERRRRRRPTTASRSEEPVS